MHRSRYFVALALAALVAAPAACTRDGSDASSAAASDSKPRYGGTVLRHLESDCKTLNWVMYTTTSELWVLRCLHDYLLDYDENLNIVPVLAKEFSVSNDRLDITVQLKENLRWHDGKPITADDVKFTVERILDPAVPAVNKRAWFKKLDRVEVADPLTVVFHWKEPYAPSLHALTELAPIPKHVYDEGDFMKHPANRAPIGSGAFKFESWQTSQSITLVRNEDYHGKRPYLDRVVFRVIPDHAVALQALKTGQIDEMRVLQEQWENQTNDDEFLDHFSKTYYYVPQYNYLSWNCRSVWFEDKRVRRAMTMLFDRETIKNELYSGYAEVVSGPYYINSWAYDKSVQPWPYDPAAAREILDEAGWTDSDGDGIRDKDGVKFSFEFYVSLSRVAKNFAELLQEGCAKAGIEVKIRQMENATFFDKVFKGEYDATALAWSLDNDPDNYDTFHSSQVPPIGLNHAFYSNASVDSLLEMGRREFDTEKRAEIYHRIHRLIHEDSPYTFVNSVPEKRPINKRVGNVVISPLGPFKFYPGAIYWYVKEDVLEAKS